MADSQSAPETLSERTAPLLNPAFSDIKVQKIAKIRARIEALNAEIASTSEKLNAVTAELKSPAAETVKLHISLLHSYNEIRDIGQGLIGIVAENRGVRVAELYGSGGFGVLPGD